MKLVAQYPLYKRIDASNDMLPAGFINNGDAIEVVDIVSGKAIDGNSTWYKGADGYFYWSGGFNNGDFTLESKNYYALPQEEQYELVSAAIRYYYDEFKSSGIDLTGMSATVKRRDETDLGYYAITVYVNSKGTFNGIPVPATVSYNGYSIPTDVLEINESKAIALSESISRKGVDVFGTAGVVLKKNNIDYLITNYHVACDDLLAAGIFSVNEDNLPANNRIVQPASLFGGNAVIGDLAEARLDFFIDIALIELNINLSNNIHGIPINGVVNADTNNKINALRNTGIKIWGAKTNRLITGKIEDTNVIIDVSYNHGIKKTLFGMFRARLTTPAEEGDSGSAVIDNNGMLIGIVVSKGFADNNVYIIPTSVILKSFQLNF